MKTATQKLFDESGKKTLIAPEQYINQMQKAISEEMEIRGHCWLIDNALASGEIGERDWKAIICWVRKITFVNSFDAEEQQKRVAKNTRYPLSKQQEQNLLSIYQNNYDSAVAEKREMFERLNTEISTLKQEKAALEQSRNQLESFTFQLAGEKERLHQETEQLQSFLQQQRDVAEAEAQSIICQAKQRAEIIRAEMIHGFTMEETQKIHSEEPAEENLRDEISQKTRDLGNDMRIALDNYRDQIQTMLYDFSTGLYQTNYKILCSTYQRLYCFVTDVFVKRIEALCQEIADEEVSSQIRQSLYKFQGQLVRNVVNLENGLTKLDLTVYYPEKGEEYHASYHIADNVEDDGYLEAMVRQCICPGIMYKDHILCQAVVIVDKLADEDMDTDTSADEALDTEE